MKTLIVIPAYNEQDAILDVVEELRLCCPEMDYIVIDDCSEDETLQLLSKKKIPHLTLACNLGIGGCVQAGYQYAVEKGYELVVQFDGDGQHDARYLHELIRPVEEGHADIAVGSRFVERQGFQSSPARRLGIGFLSRLLRLLCGVRVSDVTSGLRAVGPAFVAEYAQSYAQDYPEPEALLAAAMKGARIVEVPVMMRERKSGASSIGPFRSVYYIVKVTLALILSRLSA